jgi:hypothetical protein
MPDITRALANMEVVLDQHCEGLPHGGNHEYRKFIAERLRMAVAEGETTLGELHAVAQKAENEYKNRRK